MKVVGFLGVVVVNLDVTGTGVNLVNWGLKSLSVNMDENGGAAVTEKGFSVGLIS